MRREEVHVLVVAREFKGDVRDDDAERQRLDTDLLVGILALGVEEAHDVGVVGVEIDRTGTLPRAELVGVGKTVLQELHHRDDARRLVLDLLDRRAHLAKVGERQGHAAAALRKLQGGIYRAADRFHVVLDAQQEAGHKLAPLFLAGIEEGRRRRLEPARDDLVDEIAGKLLAAGRKRQRHHADTVLVPLEIALPVEGLQRVGGVILEGAEEGRETELPRIGLVEEIAHEVEGILVEDFLLVIAFRHQVIELLPQVMEEDGVLVDVAQEILLRRLAVAVELDPPLIVIEVQHGVQRMIIERRFCRGARFRLGQRVQNRSSPCLTAMTSSAVPRSSNR